MKVIAPWVVGSGKGTSPACPTEGAAQPEISRLAFYSEGDEMKTAETVGAGDLADWLGVTSQTISAFANDNKVVRVSRGKYELKASVQLYTAHLREVAAARGGEAGVLDLVQERARLAKEQADNTALKNASLRRELLPAAEVEREWSDILRKVRAGILATTSRVRASAGLTAEQAVEMDAELRLALKDLGNDKNHEAGGATCADPAHEAAAIAVDRS
jgi:phage terminase Nu1 subunit (DNA packaging protein)